MLNLKIIHVLVDIINGMSTTKCKTTRTNYVVIKFRRSVCNLPEERLSEMIGFLAGTTVEMNTAGQPSNRSHDGA